MYYAKYGSGLLRVSMSYAKQGVNRKQTLHPGSPGDLQTTSYHKFLIIKRLQQIPRIQWVACRTVPVIGARAVHGRWHTIPVAIRWPIIPIPLHVGDRQAPETYRFRCNQGQKGSVMHRFRGYRGNWMPRNTKYHHGFPGSGVARGP